MRATVEPAQVQLVGALAAIEGEDLGMTCLTSSSNPPAHIRWWLGHKEVNATAVATEEVSPLEEARVSGAVHDGSLRHREGAGVELAAMFRVVLSIGSPCSSDNRTRLRLPTAAGQVCGW